MSEDDLYSGVESMRKFLSVNKFIFSIIKKKIEITDYDYLANYEAIVNKKDIKWQDNMTHKLMLQSTARMIQENSKGSTKHEYFLKVNTTIYDTTSDKEIFNKHREITNIVRQFPVQFWIEKMLSSKEVIILLLKELRFFNSELNTINKTDLKKHGYYKNLLNID